jgi:hypothetical protein
MTLPGDHSADPDLALRIPRGDIARNNKDLSRVIGGTLDKRSERRLL